MFTLFFRAIILYVVLVVSMRAMGRRQLGQFQPYEFALTILLADLISSPMESISTPLLHGLIPMVAILTIHGVICMLALKFDGVRAVISGKPVVVMSKGVIDQKALKDLCLSLSDLLEGLREVGISDPCQVESAICEADGKITAFPKASMRPPTTQEMGVATEYEGLPLMLVMDGRVQKSNLQKSGQDGAWLARIMKDRGLDASQVFLASLDTQGRLTVQRRDGNLMQFEALDPGKVAW